MEQDLVQDLLADTALAALLDDGSGGVRIHWNVRPQGAGLPAVTLHRITSGRGYTMAAADALTGALVQMDVWASTFTSLVAVRDALVSRLHAPGSARLRRCFVRAERQTFEPGEGAADTDYHRASLDVVVWHQPA